MVPMIEVLLLSSLAAPIPVEPIGETEVHAIIVAHNRAPGTSFAPLRYADDDGARYFELLSTVAANVDLLSVLDAPTQRMYPKAARAARVPSLSELDSALDRTFRRMRQARAEGQRTALYFIYVGHGSVGDDGQGQIHLTDGRFTRRHDLYRDVLAKSPATVNHVVIDACHAYFMVAKRGENRKQAWNQALSSFLAKEELSAYPNTGVLLSTSQAAEVHEWSRFSAGVFSHEVRSAMSGAADVNLDGAVTYDEVLAFIAAANARIDDPKAKLAVYGQPPKLRVDEPVFHLRQASRAPHLKIPRSLSGRYYLEDSRGVRYADFHSAADADVNIVLVPNEAYYLRNETSEFRIPTNVRRRINVAELPRHSLAMATRGSTVDNFRRRLFSIPFGPAYFAGYSASPNRRAPLDLTLQATAPRGWRTKHTVGISLAGLAVAAAGAGIVLGSMSSETADQFRAGIGTEEELAAVRKESRDQALAANILFGTAGALMTAAFTAWLWPDD